MKACADGVGRKDHGRSSSSRLRGQWRPVYKVRIMLRIAPTQAAVSSSKYFNQRATRDVLLS
jgi:hypothetical protein